MHIDLNSDPPAPQNTDVCVIGAGIAGLLLALRLADAGKTVTLLEAGGMQLKSESQELYRAEMARERHTGTHEGRFRTFGGSSVRWGGQCLPYPPDVFQPEPGTLSAGWPLTSSDNALYYPELQRLLRIDSLPFDATLLSALKRSTVPVSGDFVLRFSKWIPFRYRNLGETVGKRLLAHPRVTVYAHSNAVALETEDDRVTGVRVRNYAGRNYLFPADTVVVCAGTVESSRLLLCSPGIPDAHGQIGRGFHDHLSVPVASYSATASRAILRALGPFFHRGTMHTFKLEAAGNLRRREHLLNVMAHISISEPEGSGTAALRTALSSWQTGGVSGILQSRFRGLGRGALTALRLLLWARFAGRRAVSAEASIGLRIDVEQPARPDSRITLSANLDALGMPKAVVHWAVGDQERHTVLTYAGHLRQELERLGLAPDRWHDLSAGFTLADTYHPMGGLCMGTDPRASVVDTNLKLHGIANLYAAGCSVFPSGGSSNPTFTAMALALRLADYLTRRPAMDE